jgi:ABC-type dipeptide/oligopeptide/nickel transport system ATPase subunit/GNAT superfamily N-acetyltransferase
MSRIDLINEVSVERSARVAQLEGIFELESSNTSRFVRECNVPLDDDWQVGLIVGPSGSGKTSLARKLFGEERIDTPFAWHHDKAIIDDIAPTLPIKQVIKVLSSVGFSSPPAWLRPFHCLSNGEQFRATMARRLLESEALFVVDEFTSVVDRTVAKIGACAFAKTVRQSGKQFVAVSCHYDIIEWLSPDWVYHVVEDRFDRGSLRRPEIRIDIRRVTSEAWRFFREHHYLNTSLHKAAKCFMASVDGRPAAFVSAISFPHAKRAGWTGHRLVCLPDFQGVGIGKALHNYLASLFHATGKPYFSSTSHPAVVATLAQQSDWIMTRKPSLAGKFGKNAVRRGDKTAAHQRLTASFEYVGEARPHDAVEFGVVKVET